MSAAASHGIQCPRCQAVQHRTLDTRMTSGAIRRRRKCKACHLPFTTYERVGKEAK